MGRSATATKKKRKKYYSQTQRFNICHPLLQVPALPRHWMTNIKALCLTVIFHSYSPELLNSNLQHCPILLSSWDSFDPVVKQRAATNCSMGDPAIFPFPKTMHRPNLPLLFVSNKEAVGATEMTVLTLRRLMSYIYGAPILDVSRSHTTTQHSR